MEGAPFLAYGPMYMPKICIYAGKYYVYISVRWQAHLRDPQTQP